MSRRALAGFVVTAVAVATGLVLALALGAPDPNVAERAGAGALGALAIAAALLVAVPFVRGEARGSSSPGARDAAPTDAGATATVSLERSLRFGASSAADYHAHVRPRLQTLAAARLGRLGCSLDDPAGASAVLGAEAYALVAPAPGDPGDRRAAGVAVEAVARLVDRVAQLGGPT